MIVPAQIFEKIPERFDPETAGDLNATYQFNLTGDNGGSWWVKVADQTCTTGEGTADEITSTLNMSDTDYVALALGEMNPMLAFTMGKIKADGDYMALMHLKKLFDKM